ncbi:MAG: hypothetical protein LBM04_06955 [Opitutaceae bacterium]|nr:hypothetical protein [Opitutaceae bacterium]
MNTAENAWQWVVANKETLWEILGCIPLREIITSVFAGAVCGLLIGVALCVVLQKTGLLTRRTKWLNIVVKINWLFIPALLVFAGAQVALVRCAWKSADGIIVSNEAVIRKYTGEFFGQVQTRLDALIEESPSLKDASLNTLIDAAIDGTVAESAAENPSKGAAENPSETAAENPSETAPAAQSASPAVTEKIMGWIRQTARSAYLRATLKAVLSKTAQKISGADKTTVEMAFNKTLGEMTDANIICNFARERLRRFMWSFTAAVLLHTLPLLLVPALEISLSKWRKW